MPKHTRAAPITYPGRSRLASYGRVPFPQLCVGFYLLYPTNRYSLTKCTWRYIGRGIEKAPILQNAHGLCFLAPHNHFVVFPTPIHNLFPCLLQRCNTQRTLTAAVGVWSLCHRVPCLIRCRCWWIVPPLQLTALDWWQQQLFHGRSNAPINARLVHCSWFGRQPD